MKYRLNNFFARKNYAANATEVINLNIKDIISNIVLKVETVNVGDPVIEHPIKIFNKIELVDGSDVLYSLNGFQAEALDWYANGGKFRSNWNWCLTGQSITRTLAINFGRYLWDTEWALDPGQFSNLQLRLTINPAVGGNTPSSVYITAWANIFESAPSGLRGFLMSKEIKQYTMAASTHEYTDLPLDYPIRSLYIQPFLRGTESHQCIQNVKLSEDSDRMIPYDHGINDIMTALKDSYPLCEESYILPVTTAGVYCYITPTTHVTAVGSRWEAVNTATSINCYNGDGGRLDVYGSASANAQVHVRGDVPHACFEIPFGRKMDTADWYDTRGLGNLKLDITGGAAAACHLFLEQARSY